MKILAFACALLALAAALFELPDPLVGRDGSKITRARNGTPSPA